MNLSALHYLYLEDDMPSRRVLKMMLTRAIGATNITMMEDSTDFLERIRSLPRRPDIILMDIHMQPYSGFVMLEALRSDPDYSHMPIVALTASVMQEEIAQLREAGFDGAISKPISITTFPALLQRVVEGQPVWYIR